MRLPDYINDIIKRLEDAGYEAYAVGGCVRDFLLGKCPDDYDITTSALPEQIIGLFSDKTVIPTGLKHGTVTLLYDGKPTEITTFRIDGEYNDHRRPDSVTFTDKLPLDLSRRDFTINALAYSDRTGIVDLFGGMEDIKNGIIRCVGSPEKRFEEDGLRVLRALRFASKCGFRLEEDTARAVHEKAYLLENISAERIQSELCGIIMGSCEKLLIEYSDIICRIIPEMQRCVGFEQHSKYHDKTVYEHIAATVAAAEPRLEYRLTMLLHDIGKPDAFFMEDGVGHFYGHAKYSTEIARNVLHRLKFSNKITEKVIFLVENHGVQMNDSEKYFRRAIAKYGEENFFDLLKIHYYDNSGKAPQYEKDKELFVDIEKHAHEYIKRIPPLTLKTLAVSGGDLITLGYRGRQIGDALSFLLDEVIEERCENDKQKLLRYLENAYIKPERKE